MKTLQGLNGACKKATCLYTLLLSEFIGNGLQILTASRWPDSKKMFYAARYQDNTHLQSDKRSRSDPTTSSINVEAILFRTVPVHVLEDHLDDLQHWCKPALATSAKEAKIDRLVDPPRWGNSQGLSTLEKIDKLVSDVRRLEEKATNQSTEIANMNTKMAVMGNKLDIMAPESSSYLAVRNRFFSTYCRDIIGSTTSKDRDAVPLGNKKAHGGDIIAERRLYANGTRFDDEIFQDLYGIHWTCVRQIGKISAI